jgi:hypothetical protein
MAGALALASALYYVIGVTRGINDGRRDEPAGADILDRAIPARFAPLARFGPRAVWVRRP